MFRWNHPPRTDQKAPTEAMAALERIGYADLAAVVGGAEGQQRIRNIWRGIDETVAGETAVKRLFAGISQDGARYLEVYGRGGLYDVDVERSVWVVSADLTAHTNIRIAAGERGVGTRSGVVPVRFEDPAMSSSGRWAELLLRPARLGGTSTFYREANNPHAYGGEVFPVASLQEMADFDRGALRGAAADNGEAAAHGIKINAPPYVVPPSEDIDDISV